ncbi:hypothetical protein ABGB17_09850 [Sphaerisporangium sp. B11E5]|uniref:phosphotransferase-like protein n=1 Tax=Sphaerisporangium sp. B11E5 TaxID=3153563 RepID=UPI00325C97EA
MTASTKLGAVRSRGDRVPGMAAAQAEVVHEGVVYDVEVDTTRTASLACAEIIADRVRRSGEGPRSPHQS